MRPYNYYFEKRGGVSVSYPSSYEDIEWVNFWINNSHNDKQRKRRYLFLGDSSLRMIRKIAQRESCCDIDLLATSSTFEHSFFSSQINAFFMNNPFSYDGIFIQIGYHFLKNIKGNWLEKEDLNQYEYGYMAIVDYLKQFSSNIIILSSFTAVIPQRNRIGAILNRFCIINERLDEESNYIIEKKNTIAHEVAQKTGCSYIDIKSIMQKHPRLRRCDPIHYYPNGLRFATKEILKLIPPQQ